MLRIPLSLRYLPIALFCCLVCILPVSVSGQRSAETDSVSRYEYLLEHAETPGEVKEASTWLNEYYGKKITTDEADVPRYDLADPLVTFHGERVTDTETWNRVRRPEILEIFREQVYGRVPELDYDLEIDVRSVDRHALGGLATRKQVSLKISGGNPGLSIEVLMYLPNRYKEPVPAVMGLNFYGNQTIHSDPGIAVSEKWMRPNESIGIRNNRATEETGGVYSERWQVEAILKRGYGVITAYAGDIEPDEYGRLDQGVRSLSYQDGEMPPPDEWGTIAAWAWGLSRMMDYAENDEAIDSKRIALIGHSRLGKTALWAGAQDTRFALVISNNSGCGGAALSARRFGETVGAINTRFPHWFCRNFNRYNDRETDLPVDQHLLLALIAPRPLYIASAEDDLWADPKGEFLAARAASPVYELFGREGLPRITNPKVDQPVTGTIAYHVRTGGHGVTAYDWDNYLDFMDRYFNE